MLCVSSDVTDIALDQNVTFGKYFGVLAFVLDSDKKFNFFGHQNRAILLKAQPFLSTELGPARIYIVGSLNCALTYMNTVEEDTVWKPACPQLAIFMKASKDYIADPKSVLNVIFEETSCEHYNTINKCFPSWPIFCNWIFDCPVKGAAVTSSAPGEELYACYFKEFPGQREKIKSKKSS